MVLDEASSSSVTSSPLHNFSAMPLHPPAAPTPPWLLRELRSDERGLCLIHLLLNCAAAAAGRLDAALEHIASLAAPDGHGLDVPFQFNPVICRLEALDVESLRVKTGEALAITSSLQLHCLLASDDESAANSKDANNNKTAAAERRSPESGVSPSTSRADAFLGALWGLSPKVMVLTEQEASHNAAALTERFLAPLMEGLEVSEDDALGEESGRRHGFGQWVRGHLARGPLWPATVTAAAGRFAASTSASSSASWVRRYKSASSAASASGGAVARRNSVSVASASAAALGGRLEAIAEPGAPAAGATARAAAAAAAGARGAPARGATGAGRGRWRAP